MIGPFSQFLSTPFRCRVFVFVVLFLEKTKSQLVARGTRTRNTHADTPPPPPTPTAASLRVDWGDVTGARLCFFPQVFLRDIYFCPTPPTLPLLEQGTVHGTWQLCMICVRRLAIFVRAPYLYYIAVVCRLPSFLH